MTNEEIVSYLEATIPSVRKWRNDRRFRVAAWAAARRELYAARQRGKPFNKSTLGLYIQALHNVVFGCQLDTFRK